MTESEDSLWASSILNSEASEQRKTVGNFLFPSQKRVRKDKEAFHRYREVQKLKKKLRTLKNITKMEGLEEDPIFSRLMGALMTLNTKLDYCLENIDNIRHIGQRLGL